jgi:peptidoglycan-associated lipoprotein
MRLSKVFLAMFLVVASMTFVNCANQNKKVSTLRKVYFDYDKDFIRSDMVPVMNDNVSAMTYRTTHSSERSRKHHMNRKTHSGNVLIEGHCDERGSNEYNYALGHRRAESAKSYMVTHGVGPDRLRTTSYGEDRPMCKQHDDECWAKNRRAEFMRD